MSTRFLKTAALVILSAFAAVALADTEAPGRVGRVSLSQGQVTISGEEGDEAEAALVNWPVTSRNQLATGAGARTEIRVGSTAIRLDADSALDVIELDDENLRLHLHYGSASVSVRNGEVLAGFELSTPQGSVRMQEPGRMRVDAGRRQDTTSVSVFDGVATVDGGGSRLVVRPGKRVEVTADDVRTGLAMRDSFDEWAMLRDERDERSQSARYVTREMTGYEDLDAHGAWREDAEYGPLWAPRSVPAGWVPYRDGRWAYVHPWGWTWVDNAPWGYAPFHYGRWVMVNQRWCWAPGRNITRVVWSPALVGWVGGSNWSVGFSSGGQRPAQGWYPLSPREAYVPTYRINHDRLRWVNRHSGEARDDIRGGGRRYDHRQRDGLTVVPHDRFSQRGTVVVPSMPRAVVSTSLLMAAKPAVPPAPMLVGRRERDGDGRADSRYQRYQRNDGYRDGARPATVLNVPSQPRGDNRQLPIRRELSSNMPTPAPALPPELQGQPQLQQRRRASELEQQRQVLQQQQQQQLQQQGTPVRVQRIERDSDIGRERIQSSPRFGRGEERQQQYEEQPRRQRAYEQPQQPSFAPQPQFQRSAPVQQQMQPQMQAQPRPQPQPQLQAQPQPAQQLMSRPQPQPQAQAQQARPQRDDGDENRRRGREDTNRQLR